MATPKKSATTKTGTKKPAAKKTLAKKVADKKKTSKNVVSKKKGDQRADVKKATAGKASAKKSTSTSKKATISKAATLRSAPKTQNASKASLKTAPTKAAKVATGKVAKAAQAKKKITKEKVVAKKNDGFFRCSVSGLVVKSEKPNISEKTLQKLKELLEEELQKHVEQKNDLLRDADDLIADREGGDTVFDEESGEGDSVAVERERSLYLAAETQHTINQIEAALLKIQNKTYGVCGPSSRRISVDRLTAIPWTDVCVDCKTRSERRL